MKYKPLFRKPFRLFGVGVSLLFWAALSFLLYPTVFAYATAFLFIVCLIQFFMDLRSGA